MTVAASIYGVGDRIVPRERIRTMRMQRHLVVAVLACAAYVASGPSVYSLLEVVILSAFIGVVLGSLARAADARLGNGWGWLYGEPVLDTAGSIGRRHPPPSHLGSDQPLVGC
jgi:hypothetical protein